jgi:acetyl esterase/lipase
MSRRLPVVVALLLAVVLPAAAQSGRAASEWTALVANATRVVTDITYVRASNEDQQLDVYVPRTPGPHPTLLHIHGGGWVGGSRESVLLRALPYLEMGMAVVNISYRLGQVAPAPAAVEDGLCALKWIGRNAKEYGFDTARIVTMGYSAGGHLALTTGMIPASAGLDRQCPGELPRVAAIVNWFGITDVADLLDGPNTRTYAVQWLGAQPNREAVAARVSPLTYIRKDLPPTLIIHGDADPTVPYSHGVRLHEALQKTGVRVELVTIPKGLHGNFPPAEQRRAVEAVRTFLSAQNVLTSAPPDR